MIGLLIRDCLALGFRPLFLGKDSFGLSKALIEGWLAIDLRDIFFGLSGLS